MSESYSLLEHWVLCKTFHVNMFNPFTLNDLWDILDSEFGDKFWANNSCQWLIWQRKRRRKDDAETEMKMMIIVEKKEKSKWY